MPDLLLLLESSRITPDELAAAAKAIQVQIDRDFSPIWGVSGTLVLGGGNNPWEFHLQDGIDQASDLGYHVNDAGVPEAKIDVAGAIASGNDWATVLSHEVLEALADPACTRMAPDSSTIVEVCDPVESTTYEIDGIYVSDFVTPSYFGIDSGTRYDFLGRLSGRAPTLLGGGYILQLVGNQWVSHFGRLADGSLSWMSTRPKGRSEWRANTLRTLVP